MTDEADVEGNGLGQGSNERPLEYEAAVLTTTLYYSMKNTCRAVQCSCLFGKHEHSTSHQLCEDL